MQGNQNKKHGLVVQFNLRISQELKNRLVRLAKQLSKPNAPVTPSDAARQLIEAQIDAALADTGPPLG